MAIRNPRTWFELEQTLKELFGFKDQFTSQNLDFHGRRITNAGHSVDLDDYVIRRELIDRIGGGISQRPIAKRTTSAGVYDKVTFGLGIGASVSIGTDLTPPYIWSNSASGRPSIILVACNEPPAGDDIDFNIKRNGVSIFTAGKFTIPNGTGIKTVISSTTAFTSSLVFTRPNVMSIDVTKIGTTAPGRGIEIVIFCGLI